MNNHSCYNCNFCLNWYYISHELGIYTYMCAWNVLCKFYKRYSYSICLSTVYHSGLLGYGRPFRIFLLLYFGTRLGFRNKKCLRFALMYIVHCTIHSWESDEDVKPSLNCLFNVHIISGVMWLLTIPKWFLKKVHIYVCMYVCHVYIYIVMVQYVHQHFVYPAFVHISFPSHPVYVVSTLPPRTTTVYCPA